MTEFQRKMSKLPTVGYQDLEELQGQVARWTEHNFPAAQPYQPLLGALEELGELAHAHLKAEQGIRGMTDREEVRELKEDAVADIIVYLAHYCALNNLSLGLAVSRTWLRVRTRDWKQDAEHAADQEGWEDTEEIVDGLGSTVRHVRHVPSTVECPSCGGPMDEPDPGFHECTNPDCAYTEVR